MEKMHEYLMRQSHHYKKWHSNPRHVYYHWGLFLSLVLLTWALGTKTIRELTIQSDTDTFAQSVQTTYLETFDGLPTTPAAYRSNRVATTVHHRNLPGDTFDYDTGNPPSMPAQHGSDCVPPPGTHTISNRADFVFNCRNHIMTSMVGRPYGDTVITPAAEIDWSSGQATLRWAMSTSRASARDWWDIFITPNADFLALPASEIVDNDLNGSPRNSLFVNLDLFTDAIGSGLEKNGVLQPWPQSLDSQYFSNVVVPDPARRDIFELTITKAGRVTLRMPAYNNAIIFDEQYPSPFTFDGGMVQFSHHSYSPDKGCDLDPRFRPSVNQPCGNGTTWHWDDIFISPAKPLNLINATPSYAGGAATTARFTFDSPVPANAKLEFSALGAVDLNFGSGFTRAVPQETDKDVLHTSSYFVPAPAGATYVDVKLSNEGSTQSFMLHAKDFHVWSQASGGTAPTIGVPTATPIPTTTVAIPTPTMTPIPTTAIPTPTNTPIPTTVISTPTSAPTAGTLILGNTTVGTLTDSSNSNYMNSTRFTMGNRNGLVTSLSAHVGSIAQSPNDQFEMAIYTNNNGVPGSLVAKSSRGTLRTNSWNTVAISANLTAGTVYWIGYNTNGTSASVNNLHYISAGAGKTAWSTRGQAFGTWPTVFGAATKQSVSFSVYATYRPL